MFENEPDQRSDDCIIWAIRFFLGRDPVNLDEIEFHRAHDSFSSLRTAFCQTVEFKAFYKAVTHEKLGYSTPLFLLPNEENSLLQFEYPTLNGLTSQLCTYNQFKELDYTYWCKEMGVIPALHRKQWEFVWILSAMKKAGVITKGFRALGFGTGKEPIPSILSKYGLFVTASDAPIENDIVQGWSSTNQYSQNVMDLWKPEIVQQDIFEKMTSWLPIDMNEIPSNLTDFDICWSACAFEHLGSIEKGLQFVKNSLKTLKPGGFSIHTTEFNLTSNENTIESMGLSIFRKQDIERLSNDLVAKGHKVWKINFHPGCDPIDEIIDMPPYGLPHLKLEISKFSCTSIGLVIQKSIY